MRAGRVLVIMVALLGLVLAGCTTAKPGASGGSVATATTTSPPAPPAQLAITPAPGGQNIDPSAPITVKATVGKITDVQVHTAGDAVTGTLSPDGKTWTSNGTLNVSQGYSVTATGVNSAGKSVTQTSSFSTLAPSRTFHAHIFEGDHKAYGVGMPIQITFPKTHIQNKAAVEAAMRLTTSQPVVGAWYWVNDEELDFRPRDYWPHNIEVSFTGMLNGVQEAPGVYGSEDLTQTFEIGDALIVTASTTTHHMQVFDNGALQHDWPISTGKPGHDTPNGTYLTIDKANPQEMKPSDIAPGQPGYYDLKVPWSVRFTWSGDFLHDAYWSVGQQGSTDVSHGCVNMPPAAAQEYYQEELPGDPVTITDSPLAGTQGDGWTDWFLNWDQLVAGSALHQAVQAGPTGSTFVDASSSPASTATVPMGTAAPNNANAG